ncbi:zinc finger protein with KRAB and SCAN domains 8-like [Argiope bruennichi]|uniref:zinc finger protein with KRAB and SCAN domains 8-like n=1 Tax=Argiope bruennichi TaxID=94029 RepID=UPI002495A431|nr:zinc finger protein with KRAB and SCAN domains 8-like [Argiope bruennichi]
MVRYLCQSCNRTYIYGEIHHCKFYKNNGYVFLPRRSEESEELNKKNGDRKGTFKERKDDNNETLYQEARQYDSEKTTLMNSSINENNDKVFFLPVSNRKRKMKISTETTSHHAQIRNLPGTPILDVQANNENASVNVLPENIENSSNSERGSKSACTKTTDNTGSLHEQNKGGSNHSNSTSGKASEECRMSLEEIKWQSLNNDKDLFMDSLECVIKSALFENKNISVSKNFSMNSDFSPGNNKRKDVKFEISWDLKNELISPEVTSEDSSNSDERTENEKEVLCSRKDGNLVAGPSRIRPHKKNFICDNCTKEFKFKNWLTNHYRKHTGEKPLQCRI